LEADCKTVVRDRGICVNVGENSENASGLGVRSSSVIVVDGETGRWACILERGGECCMNEREILDESGAGPIRCLSWPVLLVLHTLKSSHTIGDAVSNDFIDDIPGRDR